MCLCGRFRDGLLWTLLSTVHLVHGFTFSGFAEGFLVTCPDFSIDLQEQRARLSGKIYFFDWVRERHRKVQAGAFTTSGHGVYSLFVTRVSPTWAWASW